MSLFAKRSSPQQSPDWQIGDTKLELVSNLAWRPAVENSDSPERIALGHHVRQSGDERENRCPETSSIACLELCRAHALSGHTDMAKTAYRDFLAFWNDADPNIPVLKETKAEYVKLH